MPRTNSSKRGLAVCVLAAGMGTRMKSDKAKVLHELAGRPLVAHVLAEAFRLSPERVVVIVGRQAPLVRKILETRFPGKPIAYALQKQRLGTGHAVRKAEAKLRDFDGDVLILSGDVPLLRAKTMRSFVAAHRKAGAALSLLSFAPAKPRGYGRILRHRDGTLAGIVEERDATPAQKRLREVNSGVYCVEARTLFRLLRKVGRKNNQGEYYLTDIVELAQAEALPCLAGGDVAEGELLGINTPEDLARAQALWEERR
ncbi:MAG: NTP transferase domain-containing protein [Deltaproteobacteria bacterium]|nr:NTP transferase domain-containing protein [Deltaproteobacteria bacterium]